MTELPPPPRPPIGALEGPWPRGVERSIRIARPCSSCGFMDSNAEVRMVDGGGRE